jgi:adenine-specific DNA-methyltransferase
MQKPTGNNPCRLLFFLDCVAYLLKAMGKRAIASDFLNFATVVAAPATVANSTYRLDSSDIEVLLAPCQNGPHFIEQTLCVPMCSA